MTSRTAAWMVSVLLLLAPCGADAEDPRKATFPFLEATVAQLQAEMAAGRLTSEQLTKAYIQRIQQLDQPGRNSVGVNSIIEVNPDALAIARQADAQRRRGKLLGPLHGIPVLLKANIDTGDQMQTTAGSLALQGTPALQDSTVAANLRAGGAVILGKTNLSEWANFRSFESVSGWSAVGGQTHNPYGLDRNPCGSSSGSGAAESANFATLSIGTETDGSIVCPANANNVVGIKPTVGLTSQAGVMPISHTQDSVGAHGFNIADAAVALGVMQSRTFDGRDSATGGVPLGWQGRFARPANLPTEYTKFLNPSGLKGARLGLVRSQIGLDNAPQQVIDAFNDVVEAIKAAGAVIIDLDAAGFTFPPASGETLVLEYDFKSDVQNYFATRIGVPVAKGTLQDAINFNDDNSDAEMPFWGQDVFTETEALLPGPDTPQTDPNLGVPVGTTYNQALAIDQAATVNGMDAALTQFHLDAVIAPTDNPAWSTDLLYGDHFVFGSSGLGAPGGYPYVQVPAAQVFGIPFGITFFGTAFSEPKLIALASGFEAVTQARIRNLPQIKPTIPEDHISGEPLKKAPHGNRPKDWSPHHL